MVKSIRKYMKYWVRSEHKICSGASPSRYEHAHRFKGFFLEGFPYSIMLVPVYPCAHLLRYIDLHFYFPHHPLLEPGVSPALLSKWSTQQIWGNQFGSSVTHWQTCLDQSVRTFFMILGFLALLSHLLSHCQKCLDQSERTFSRIHGSGCWNVSKNLIAISAFSE